MTARPHRIVFANEKGGTGKSTTAVHVAVALAFGGARVAAFDLDHRQRTMCRYFENRAETMKRRGIELPTAQCHVVEDLDEAGMEALIAAESIGADFVIIDTPGRDDPLARHAATMSDTLVTIQIKPALAETVRTALAIIAAHLRGGGISATTLLLLTSGCWDTKRVIAVSATCSATIRICSEFDWSPISAISRLPRTAGDAQA